MPMKIVPVSAITKHVALIGKAATTALLTTTARVTISCSAANNGMQLVLTARQTLPSRRGDSEHSRPRTQRQSKTQDRTLLSTGSRVV